MNKTLKFDIESQNLWFTSDTHFNHAKIIEYCHRPFKHVDEMNGTIIKNWHHVVKPEDIIFILGDFCFGKTDLWRWLVENLPGKKHLILGNHDKNFIKEFESISTILNILVHDPEIKNGQRITMCHYPMLSWYQSHRGAWQLFGHVHGGLSNKGDIRVSSNQLDVGVDVHNFTPISYRNIKTIITKQNSK